MTSHTYLLFCATGRQGKGVVKALAAKGESIVAASRNPDSSASKELLGIEQVAKVVRADMTDPDSILSAIKESGATRIWFTTDYWHIPFLKRGRKAEAQQGYNVIDAIKRAKADGECKIDHVVYSSVCDADKVSEKVVHFRGKADVEKYMAAQFADSAVGVTWSVIRPVAFFENFDDEENFNPLTKGTLKFLTYPDAPVKFISCDDIGKGSAVLLLNPAVYAGKMIDAAGAEQSGHEVTRALSEVSGTECKFKLALPRCVLYLFMSELYNMVKWFEHVGYSAEIEEFKKIVPDAQDAKAFFNSKGQWANGEKFVSKKLD